jgi:hypothetical protein
LSLLVLALAVCFPGVASANFTPPPDKSAYLPAQNVVTVTPVAAQAPNVDSYSVSLPEGTVLNVTAGTPSKTVQELAAGNLAWSKFKAATLTPADQVNPFQLQMALIWFLQNIGRPHYGL